MRRVFSSNLGFRVSVFSSLRSNSSLVSTITCSAAAFPISTPNTINPISKSDLETLVLQQYHQGKFHNLLRNVIAKPSVLLAACTNLYPNNLSDGADLESFITDSVPKRFSIEEMAHQLRSNQFDVEACCVRMLPSRKKGESLILPNLKLKVVMEAVRMVLEVVYDSRFMTFVYGGRVGMGRHTAIRYIKNTVENPRWWFRVCLAPDVFSSRHISKLSSIVGEKIGDGFLIDLIKKLFEYDVVRIELGGCYLGRGFPQESSLSSILLNIYLNGFDKEIQDFRLQIVKENPRFNHEELSEGVFHKPPKIYAIRSCC